MYAAEDIRHVHLEMTSRCNASCPQCPRNYAGGRLNERMPLTELTLADAQVIFPPEFIRQLRRMNMCGNYGDAIVARDTLAVFQHFHSVNPTMKLGLHTHGSGRTPSWWASLAKVVTYCRFGIDGLEDTNGLYRRGTQWSKIMRSVEAFIGAGGWAEWDFIVFRHNEHQVEAARELSRRLGFKQFFVKRTNRFSRVNRGRSDAPAQAGVEQRLAVTDPSGKIVYWLEMPENPIYLNPGMGSASPKAQTESVAQVPKAEAIACRVVATKSIYVSAEGLAFPCCYTAHIYLRGQPPEASEVYRLLQQLPDGKQSLDARLHPLKEIVAGPFFQKLIPERWRHGSVAEGNLEICTRVCGGAADNMFAMKHVRAGPQACAG